MIGRLIEYGLIVTAVLVVIFDKAYDEAYKATTNANTALSRR
jgi:hypothetical protein